MLTRWHQLSKKAQWLIAIGTIFGGLIVIGALAGTSDEPTSVAPTAAETVTETTETVTETVTEDSSEDSTEDSTEDFSSGLTPGQENAVRSAESYLNTSAFSRKSLIEQLKYEGYSTAEATFAVDNVTVDWNEQAALSAESYLRTSSFSRSGLLEQLLYEGFTRAQATYGVNQAY